MTFWDALGGMGPESGIVLVLAYGILVRYWIRPPLARRWDYFKENQSAPYFALFIVALLLCAGLLVSDLVPAAQVAARASYYILAAGAIGQFVEGVAQKQ